MEVLILLFMCCTSPCYPPLVLLAGLLGEAALEKFLQPKHSKLGLRPVGLISCLLNLRLLTQVCLTSRECWSTFGRHRLFLSVVRQDPE